jgi:hypothetical protein
MHPSRFQVDDALFEEIVERFGVDAAAYDRDLPNRFLTGWCRARGVACLDLVPAFRAAPGPLYRPNDVHYTLAGNDLAAAGLEAFLVERGLVPEAAR